MMAMKVEHEIHKRRLSRNLGVGLALVFFAAIVFGLTVVKVTSGMSFEAFDHVVRPQMEPEQ